MSNLATIAPPRPKSVTMDMADRYGMEAPTFERTLRATVFPANAPVEEFAAFLLVAKQYSLNPITKEIYAFPKKGGGIVPVVSIDGWMNLINSNPAFDGMEFEEYHAGDGALESIKCTIYRKDRAHPVAVTEYLSECVRATEPWKMKHRMLRHKAAIQCARYAFGFAGIYDEDEAEKIAAAPKDAHLMVAPPPPPAAMDKIEARAALVDAEKPPAREAAQEPLIAPDYETMRKQFQAAAKAAPDMDMLDAAWASLVEPYYDGLLPPDQEDITGIHRAREREIAP